MANVWSSQITFRENELHLSGMPAHKLARDFGTPTFFIDEADFRERASAWSAALNESFGENAGHVYYAGKAFICVEVVKWIADCGIGLDVCTGGELAVALAANFPASKIQVHGNNKSVAEIDKAVEIGVGTIVVDSLIEIDRVAQAARSQGKVQPILLRLTPGIEAHTHESIATAHEDVKFGFSIASGAAWSAVLSAQSHPEIELRGFHGHIGSQILSMDAFAVSADRLIELMGKYRDEFGVQLPELDLGGGYGISYLPEDEPLLSSTVLPFLANAVKTSCAAYGVDIPRISIEPGRAIVGPSMFTMYEVGTTKMVLLETGETRNYISIDGGMSDNIRPALYGAEYITVLANRTSTAPFISSRVVGKHCETGDIVIKDIELPADIVPGDLLAVPVTGAYGRSMASNYNHVPRPPVVALLNGKARVILRRETEADLLGLDV
ncbi:MAG: diaminopimelate decarboxylase [Streptomycetaceae bacterium]|nr:MAG: diaminopimelate decarboxylase [Streptomycetaceae bacterium]